MIKYLIYFFIVTSFSLTVFAHGENIPGPHGGFINMPGSFHTEVIVDKSGKSIQVYLIDIEFKNPVTKNSNVLVQFIGKKKTTDLKCIATDNYFMCTAKEILKAGTLIIKATRDGIVASQDAKYELPFKEIKKIHSMHH